MKRTSECCGTCRYASGTAGFFMTEVFCHRNPPIVNPRTGETRFPELHYSSWCGEYRQHPRYLQDSAPVYGQAAPEAKTEPGLVRSAPEILMYPLFVIGMLCQTVTGALAAAAFAASSDSNLGVIALATLVIGSLPTHMALALVVSDKHVRYVVAIAISAISACILAFGPDGGFALWLLTSTAALAIIRETMKDKAAQERSQTEAARNGTSS
jgi:hypothetical protein